MLYFPYNTVRYHLGKDSTNVDEIIVQTDTADSVDQTARAIQFSLERNHHIAKDAPDDFTITTADQLLQQVQQETGALTALLVGTVAIALTVGGIGVMNIMIVSVTERKREISIRMSLGAKRSDIRSQFLIEALVLCLVGGICGLLVGLVAGYEAVTGFGFPFVTTWITFSLPLAVSLIVGLALEWFRPHEPHDLVLKGSAGPRWGRAEQLALPDRYRRSLQCLLILQMARAMREA